MGNHRERRRTARLARAREQNHSNYGCTIACEFKGAGNYRRIPECDFPWRSGGHQSVSDSESGPTNGADRFSRNIYLYFGRYDTDGRSFTLQRPNWLAPFHCDFSRGNIDLSISLHRFSAANPTSFLDGGLRNSFLRLLSSVVILSQPLCFDAQQQGE